MATSIEPECRGRRGFTMIELLVVVGIIAVLIALLLPAIQAAREAARRVQCNKNLMQIGLAMASYASAHGVLPPGVVNGKGPISNDPSGYHFGWMVQILPYLELGAIYQSFNFSEGVYEAGNDTARQVRISSFQCPSDGSRALTNYAGCHHDVAAAIDVDNHGLLFLNSRIGRDDVPDGRAFTILAGEILGNGTGLGWAVGTTWSLRNTGPPINSPDLSPSGPVPGRGPVRENDPKEIAALVEADALPASHVGGFSSHHPRGANFLFADGRVKFLSEKIRAEVYRSLGHRADGNLISQDDY